jgi:glycosyltransferase involved in cell wall biosynthesis
LTSKLRIFMRIGFLTTEFPPAFGTGLATYTGVAATAWVAAGHEVHVLAPVRSALTRDGVTVHPFALAPRTDDVFGLALRGFGDEYERAFLLQTRLHAFIRETGIDVLECQDTYGLSYFFLHERAWRTVVAQVPVVIRLQDGSTSRYLGDEVPRHSLSRYMTGFLEDGAARMADAWLAPSARIVRETRQRLGISKMQAIAAPFPVLPCESPAAARERELLFVGQLRRGNGVELLTEALRKVLPSHPGWRVRFVGGDWTDPLRGRSMRDWMTARFGTFAEQLRFDDLQRHEDVRAALARAAIVVSPSLGSTTSVAALEALASGALLVSSDGSSAADLVRNGVPGLLCRSGDAADLGRVLTSAMELSADERESMGESARAALAALASPERFVDRVARAYRRLPARARSVNVPTPPPRTARFKQAARAPETFAVIIPCFNMGDTLSETLNSVLASTRVPDEIIVVDDGSTDAGTREVLDSWASRVRLVRIENRGLSGARNAGAAVSSSDAFAFLDADDLISPEFFECGMNVLRRQPSVGFVTPWVQLFGAGDAIFCPPAPHFPLQLTRNLAVCFGLMRRETFEAAGGYKEEMRFGYEDWDFWVGVLESGWAACSIPERMFHYRWRDQSMLRSMSDVVKDSLMERMIVHHGAAYQTHHLDVRLLQLQQHIDGRDAIQSLVSAVSISGHDYVTVYGAGEWGRRLRSELVRRGVQVRRFVDGNTRLHGTVVDALPVSSLQEAVASGDRTFVVGSLSFAVAITETIHNHCQAIGVEPVVFS